MKLTERIANFLTGGALSQNQAQVESMREAIADLGWYDLTRGSVERLLETDSQLLDMIIRQRGYEPIYSTGTEYLSDSERWSTVRYSRYLALRDVTQQRVIRMWTDVGFGTRVSVIPEDPNAKTYWDEYWTARRNGPVIGQTVISRNSDTELTDGEVFFIYYQSTLDGESTVRRIPTEQITQIIFDPEDEAIPLFYVWNTNKGEVYVPDWQASTEALKQIEIPLTAKYADDLRPQTKVVMQHLAYACFNKRGWPQFMTAWEWIKVYTQFLGDRAAVARKAAMYTEKVKIKGGQRTLDAIKAKLGSTLETTGSTWEKNPPAPAASDWLENDAATREWMTRDTGAASAQIDGMMLIGQISLATGVPVHWLGRPDAMQNRATARETGLPWYEQMQRYQLFWSQAFEDMYEIVMRAISMYAPGKPEFASYAAVVSLEGTQNAQAEDVGTLISAVNQGAQAMTVDPMVAQQVNSELLRIALTALGSRDPQSLLTSQTPEQTSQESYAQDLHPYSVTGETCPGCGHGEMWEYTGHGKRGGLRLCPQCHKTYDISQ